MPLESSAQEMLSDKNLQATQQSTGVNRVLGNGGMLVLADHSWTLCRYSKLFAFGCGHSTQLGGGAGQGSLRRVGFSSVHTACDPKTPGVRPCAPGWPAWPQLSV